VPTAEEVAAASGLAVKQVWAASAQQLSVASLSAPAGEGGTELGDFLVDQSAPSPEAEATDQAMREGLRALVDKLPPRAAAVLRLRYGLSGEDPLTRDEIAARIGVSRERVRQMEQRALSNLRQDATSVVGSVRSVA
jgi:RNA polymerase sigma factor (sigma-70 family)